MITTIKDKKYVRETFFDVLCLIGLLGVTVITGLMVYRTWEMFVSIIGIRLAIAFIILFVAMVIGLVHTTVTNLAWNMSLIYKTAYTEPETADG